MKSHLSEVQISEWIAGLRGGEAEDHVRGCAECTAELERTQKALLLFRDSGYQCAEYWQKQPHARPSSRHARLGALAVSVTALILAVVLLRRSPLNEAKPIARTTQEVFLQIPYVVPPAPYERTEVVRMDVPDAALISAGFRMEAPAADSVSADVVVGQDGRPLAVGFPEEKQ